MRTPRTGRGLGQSTGITGHGHSLSRKALSGKEKRPPMQKNSVGGAMMEPVGIESLDCDKAANGFETLGPAYFAARRAAEALMKDADTSPFQDVAKKAADEVRGQVYDYIEHYILSDLECNIQGHVTRMVDDTVAALLTGQSWAMDRYPYHAYSRGEEVRAAVAKHGGDRLLMARIAELEKENERLRESLRWAQERRY